MDQHICPIGLFYCAEMIKTGPKVHDAATLLRPGRYWPWMGKLWEILHTRGDLQATWCSLQGWGIPPTFFSFPLSYFNASHSFSILSVPDIISYSLLSVIQGVLNPMQGFLFTLAFYGWTGWKVDLPWRKSEIPWESLSTSNAAENAYALPGGNSVNFHDSKKGAVAPNHQTDETLSMLSEGNLASDDRLTRNSPVYQGW